MEKAGISNKKTVNFPESLRQFMGNDNNKNMLRKIFTSEEGKQLILNSFLGSFLKSPFIQILQKYNSPLYYGFAGEVIYNLNRLSNRITRSGGIWDQLIQKINNDPALSLEDLYDITIKDRVYYNPKRETEYNNNFNLNYENMNFYSRKNTGRFFDGLGHIEFKSLGLILLTEMKNPMQETIFSDRLKIDNADNLVNDGLSSQILSLTGLLKDVELDAIIDLMMNLPTVDVVLAGPFIPDLNKFLGYMGALSVEALSNIKLFLKLFYGKNVHDIGHKLEDHELFLVKAVNLIDKEIQKFNEDNTHDSLLSEDIDSFLSELFKDPAFKEEILAIANNEFTITNPFRKKLDKGEGYNKLLIFFLNEENLEQISYSSILIRGNTHYSSLRFRLGYSQDAHFKLPTMLSVLDFPSHVINFYAGNEVVEITSDQNLQVYRNKYPGDLTVYHNVRTGDIVIVPVSQIKKNMKDSNFDPLELGYRDELGNVYINIFVGDNEGYKLASKFIFDENGYSVHTSPFWADNNGFTQDFQFDAELYTAEGIFIYRTNYYSATTIMYGSQIITGLQNINLNLEHTAFTNDVLPDLQYKKRFWGSQKSTVELRNNLNDDIKFRIEGTIPVIHQLGLTYGNKQRKPIPIRINNGFLNFQSDKKYRWYTVDKFKTSLTILNDKGSPYFDFTKITRGSILSDGTFHKNNVDKFEFYNAWLEVIKSDIAFNPQVFGNHLTISSIASITASSPNKDIALIDAALIDAFGYPAFVCLLAGIMTFAEDTTQSQGYRIDFLKHPLPEQSGLLRDFIGLPIYQKADHAPVNLDSIHGGRFKFWASLFGFGFKRERTITPGSYFRDNYFTKFIPSTPNQFSKAIDKFLIKSFSDYVGEIKTNDFLNKKSLNGRREIIDYTLPKLIMAISIKKIDNELLHSGQKIVLLNHLIQKIIEPRSEWQDITSELFKLQTNQITSAIIRVGYVPNTISYDISATDYMINSLQNNRLTADASYTMLFGSESIRKRATSRYFNDFNIPWNAERMINRNTREMRAFNDRLVDAYYILNNIIQYSEPEANLKVEFYTRTEGGIDASRPITFKQIDARTGLPRIQDGLHTDFKTHEFQINRQNPAADIVSILLWMMLEPNIFAVIKSGSMGLAYLDIYDLYDQSHINSGTVDPDNYVNAQLIWDSNPMYPRVMYDTFTGQYSRLFEYEDIIHFLGFHNHELDDNFRTIIDYIKNKVLEFFKLRGILNRESELVDLRED